jgi:hypothetical protein
MMKNLNLLCLLFLLSTTMSVAVAQTPAQTPPDARVTADETFDLNISERHIRETDFQAATAVGIATGNGSNLRVQVGVAVRASAIDVTMRNVNGTVRFRGSLQSILNLLRMRTESRLPTTK